jgi:ribonucleoside-diphosphate reductase alpha chain
MGFSDLLEKKNLAYNCEMSFNLIDEIMEFISYQAILCSTTLAQERGSYPNFNGSRWSEGYVPYDTLEILEIDRKTKLTIDKTHKLDWLSLKEKVKNGMRNSTLLAIAPTANIGLVAGTSTGIDPRFAQIFSRNTLSGKYLELNFNLVNHLKKLGLWEKTREDLLVAQGDLESLEYISDEIKEIYKDSFSIDPAAFIEIAARAQKWVDQAISRNIYLRTRDTETIMNLYMSAWEKGLKTTYYLHIKPRHSAEQSTVKVNKATASGRIGFGAIRNSSSEINVEESSINKNSCPIDPQERLLCDSCQ